jgi:hypothetical protein
LRRYAKSSTHWVGEAEAIRNMGEAGYIQVMPRKPLELPPAVARKTAREMASDALKLAARASIQASIAMIGALVALCACGFLWVR